MSVNAMCYLLLAGVFSLCMDIYISKMQQHGKKSYEFEF